MSKNWIKRAAVALLLASAMASGAAAQGVRAPTEIAPGALRSAQNAAPRSITVTCADSSLAPTGDMVLCLTPGEFVINADGPGTEYGVRLTAPSTHCATVKYSIVPVATRQGIGLTSWLGANGSEVFSLGNSLTRGAHRYQVYAWGRVGGCLGTAMHSWGVMVEPVVIP